MSNANKVGRPPNPWILYRSDKIKELKAANALNNHTMQTNLSCEIADLWNAESSQVRARYERLAKVRKEEHECEHPNYQFRPVHAEEKARLRAEKQAAKAAVPQWRPVPDRYISERSSEVFSSTHSRSSLSPDPVDVRGTSQAMPYGALAEQHLRLQMRATHRTTQERLPYPPRGDRHHSSSNPRPTSADGQERIYPNPMSYEWYEAEFSDILSSRKALAPDHGIDPTLTWSAPAPPGRKTRR